MSNTSGELWTAVDDYLIGKLIEPDAVLEAAVEASEAAGLPPIQVTPLQGKMLHLFALMVGARRILEIGTLGGYSTIWMARALPPEGRLVTLEFSPKHAAVARENLARAGVLDRVDLRQGAALDTLPKLAEEGAGPFDLVFIDADKENNTAYLDWALRLGHPGTIIVTDNVVREGKVIDANSGSPMIQGTRRFFDAVSADGRVIATAIQTVGGKTHDGFALLRVK
ncbi:MAG TPA: O-methyltransferase [Bryobacteraceae bacterium]|nr:O-methyltransferase [Bryobacteraceae bacterium]